MLIVEEDERVILDPATCRNYEIVDIGSPILGDTTLYNNESLLVLTESKVLKMRMADCSQFTTCEECIRPESPLGDPFCGWCTLEKRCTRYNECQDYNEKSRWLPYDEAECVAIAEVTPKALAREVHSQEVS
ncbi:Plexin-B2 [Holothuria leucospilota]|uniref:Plexin-B2 n=1 Tax=Holothuria leucospilota TaxID=206669 RepID=A0A9Q1CKK7_HOLLE|nr:Plexin-B2 [Holothuria leucospilota]